MKRIIPFLLGILAVVAFGQMAVAQVKCSRGVLSAINPTKGVLLNCTVAHQEYLPAPPVTLTRTFGVYIPPNYVPCGLGQSCSGTILKIQGTTHGIANDCNHATAGNENKGWLAFLDMAPAPAPVMICPQGLFDQSTSVVTNPGERWNVWGYGNAWNWRAVKGSDGLTYSGNLQIYPNDDDFVVTVLRFVQAALQTDPKYSVVTNDWVFLGNLMAYEMAALHPDLFNAVVVFNDPFGSPDWTGNPQNGYFDAYGNPIPLPAGPINVLIIAGLNSSQQSICGGIGYYPWMGSPSYNRPYTVDDTIAYWNSVNQPDTFLNEPSTATKFCKYIGHSAAAVTPLWRYVATNHQTGVTTEVWNLFASRGTPYCSYGPDGSIVPNMCSTTNPPVDWRLVKTVAPKAPGNPYADSVLGYSLLQVEFNFMNRSRRP